MQRAVGLVSTTATGLVGRLLRSDVIPVNESLHSTERTIGERTRMLPLYLAWIDELTPGSAPTADPDSFWSSHSTTSSARARIDGGIVGPSAFAVLRSTKLEGGRLLDGQKVSASGSD